MRLWGRREGRRPASKAPHRLEDGTPVLSLGALLQLLEEFRKIDISVPGGRL
jgi:hypothetical protein